MVNPGSHMPTNPPKILYVDDGTLALIYFGRAIGSLAPVITATSVEEGKCMPDQHTVTLGVLVSDWCMSSEFGNGPLRYTYERYPHLVRILMTVYSEIENTMKVVNQGQIHRYIEKPRGITALYVELKQVLEFSDLCREYDVLLRKKMIVYQSQTLTHHTGAPQTPYLTVSGLSPFSTANDYLRAAATVDLQSLAQPDWAIKNYTELVDEEGLRTREFSSAVQQVYLDLLSHFDSKLTAQVLEVLAEVLDGKVTSSDSDTTTVIDLTTLTELLEAASTHKVSDAHTKWLAFLLWLGGKDWSLTAEHNGEMIGLGLLDNQTRPMPDQLAVWMEYFQGQQAT